MMNKYQKAFERITDYFHSYTRVDGTKVHEQTITYDYCRKKLLIRELVERATRKKVIITNEYYPNNFYKYVKCPHCGDKLLGCYHNENNRLCNIYEMNFCLNCGQALDWSDSDE